MKMCPDYKNSYKPRSPGTLKQATDQLIGNCGGSTALSQLDGCRVSKQTLFAYSDGDGDDARHKYMPVDVVLFCEQICRDPVLTRYLAAEQGHTLIPIVFDCDVERLSPTTARAAQVASEVFATMATALASGVVTNGDAGKAIVEIDEALKAFATLRGHLAAIRDAAG